MTVMSLPLLQTKLHMPALRPTLVARSRLLTKLNTGLKGKLTLVAAPAGFGKTTLICDWLHQTPVPAVWLSLDAGDNEINRFLRYVIGALQNAQPTLGQEAATRLQLLQPAPVDEVLTVLLNDLATTTQKLILVLDDYHVIEAAAIHQALAFLLERLPPQLHLVITSRANPPLSLARLRGQGELTEVRAAELRFTQAEAGIFLQHFSHLILAPGDLALLAERTEGWIVGLQLAALSLEQRADVAGFVQNFSGSNIFILDYLVEEVLAQRSPASQTFLLYTSILERMCGPLCDAVLGEQRERSARADLQELEQANLFIIPLDDDRYWYRYHHLFAGVLQQRLRQAEPERIAELHERASLWFETQGLIDEAVAHARHAGNLPRVTQLIEQEIRALIMRGFFDTANRWLATLSESLIRERPRLLIAQAWLRLFEIPFGNIEAALRQAENILAQKVDQPADQQEATTPALLAEIAALRAAEAGISGKPMALQLAQEALRLAGPENLFVQSIINYALASFDWGSGQWATIQQTFQQAINTAQATGNVIIAASVRYNFAMFHMQHGDLTGADALLAQSETFTKSQPNRWPWSIVDSVWVGRGRLCYERNELDQALRLLQAGIELAQRRNNLYVIIDGWLTLALVHQAQGAGALAQVALDQAMALVSNATRPGTPQLVAAHQARLWLMQGDGERTIHWAQTQATLSNADPVAVVALRALTLAAIYIAQGAATAQQALVLLEGATEGATEWAGRRLQIYALQALAFNQLGRPTEAQQAIKQAVAIGEAAGYVRLLIDQSVDLAPLLTQLPSTPYRDKLLAALGSDRTAPSPTHSVPNRVSANQNLIEPLSERELAVLRLVIAGASNQVIADQLVITVGTVKNHMTNILGKLNVRNRWEAIRKTQEIGLL
ncbi:LuxR C-terminal-related transcriptional regulator [soil metagenome]